MSTIEDLVDVGDDSLQELINEAENLMSNLDREAAQLMGGFSIDSDEEDDEQKRLQQQQQQQQQSQPQQVQDPLRTRAPIDDHPLSMENLLSSPPAAAAPPPTAPAQVPGAEPSAASPATINGAMSQFFVNGTPPSVNVDQFKLQTSRFASGIASMAQRAAQQVAVATAPVQVTGGPTPVGFSPSYPAHQQVSKSMARTSTAPELDKEQKEQLVRDHVGQLLPGERIIMFLSHLLHVSDSAGLSYVASQSSDSYMWCGAMSYYRLILFSTASAEKVQVTKPADWHAACWPSTPAATKVIDIPLASIDRVEKTVYQAGGSSFMGIIIYSKDCGRVLRFTTPSYADTGRVFDSLNTYAFPGRRNIGYLFAFESRRQEVMASVHVDATGQQSILVPPAPRRFDPMIEYPRLLQQTSITNAPWTMWGSLNATYQLSPSYPSVLVGPATLDETQPEAQQLIRQCAVFRSEQRLPALTWCGVGGSSIWRASQPKVGLQGNRSPADELLLRHVAESARGANAMADPPPVYPRAILQQVTGDYAKDWVPEPGCGLKILDLRPRASAMANRTGGYGYENTSYYSNMTLQFCNIGNIHAVRDSYQKLCTVCNSDTTVDVNFHSLIEDTKWLSHIRTILAASWETAYWVHVWRMPILLHCSHGWDRTSQVAALAQLFLDPYYRTQHGFSTLIEKDFMSFGHPFHLRCAHGEGRSQTATPQSSSNDEGQISPIFLQFLDCVYQIVQLFPECFEFNTQYLLELSFHIYSCRFGTLLCDNERERELLAQIRQRTYSLWEYLESLPECKNASFQESSGVLLMPLPMLLRNVRLWTERHCCFSRKPTLRNVNNTCTDSSTRNNNNNNATSMDTTGHMENHSFSSSLLVADGER